MMENVMVYLLCKIKKEQIKYPIWPKTGGFASIFNENKRMILAWASHGDKAETQYRHGFHNTNKDLHMMIAKISSFY